ncbi:MAG: protein-disulfide reductase DsbD [Coxiellaceae bacterium]|nr:protein-disulfide reductase DsbD [Coxiellaceae bacterium]
MKKLYLLILLLFSVALQAQTIQPLPADQAFQLSATAKDYQTILLQWKIAPNYYLYEKNFSFVVLKPAHVLLGNPLYPAGAQSLKTPLGDFMVYAHNVILPLPIIQANEKSLVLQVNYQGCAQAGYCYPPTSKIVSINLAGNYMQWVSPLAIDVAPVVATPPSQIKKSLLLTLASFFGLGLLLSFTPCVLPMVPIISSIIVGQKNKNHFHAFLLSLFYVIGSAVSYAVIGVLFGVIGKNIQLVFQNPWVIVFFSALFIVMALSLLGVFQLQLPEKIRGFIAAKSQHQKSGSYAGVFVMGMLSTLILSPCITPPLVAALAYISQSGEVYLGGSALFMMGLGAGFPLLLIGAIGPKILPKPGRWMNVIKYAMAIFLFVIAGMLLQRIMPTKGESSPLAFQSVQTVADVNTVLAKSSHKIVMLDFYADWCVACKEFDRFTFSQPAVQAKLQNVVLLRVDLTPNSAENAAIMQYYGVIAPPTILFFQDGKELPNSRVIGYEPSSIFLTKIP